MTPSPVSPRAARGALRPRSTLRLGFVPLTDSAPVTVAREMGFFSRHGLDVRVSRELGWASIREKLSYQDLDVAHAPAPMLFRLILGLDARPTEVFTSFFLNAGGGAVTLSTNLRRAGVRTASDLKRLIRSRHPERLVFAVASLHSCQYFLLRRWLQSGGINPDREVLIAVLPHDQMLPGMKSGLIEGFCAAEPWNSAAVATGTGWCPATSAGLAPAHPEKILLTRTDYAERFPDEHEAFLRAMNEACEWCEAPANRPALADLLSSCPWFRDSQATLRPALLGPFDCGDGNRVAAADLLRFHGPNINAATDDKGAWVLAQMRSAGLLTAERVPEGALRPDLFDLALAPVSSPAASPKPRGTRKAVSGSSAVKIEENALT